METFTAAPAPLAKPRHVRVQGQVYCLDHGAIHDDTTDPYGYGAADCRKREHRPVYASLRAGDYPDGL